GHRRRRVALADDPGWLHPIQGLSYRHDAARAQIVQSLARLHEIEIDVGNDPGDLQDLVEHLAMLGRDANGDVNRRFARQALDDRVELDGSRPGTEYDKDPLGR